MHKKIAIIFIIFGLIGVITFISFYVVKNLSSNKLRDYLAEGITTDQASLNREDTGIVTTEDTSETTNVPDIISIAFLGIDSLYDSGRSDAIIIMTLDYKNKKIKLSSFMRDLKVHIHGHGYTKLGHAYNYGGGELVTRTLNDNYGLDIEKFIAVDFSSFEKIIDASGGLQININMLERAEINRTVKGSFLKNAGVQLLDGKQTLAYARIRRVGNADFERTERQRRVLEELMKKMSALPLPEINNFVFGIEDLLETNLKMEEIILLIIKYYDSGEDFERENIRFPLDGTFRSDMSSGVFYLVPHDENEMKNMVQHYIYPR